jgi:hypothetical protein
MKYPDFKDAAARHILSCNYILNMLDALKEHEKRLLLWNTYYLSGYIVECSLKFAFFKGIRYDRSKDIEDLNYVFGEREYNFERIKNQQHNLVNIKNYFNPIINHLPLDSTTPFVKQVIKNGDHNELIKQWDAQIRYSSKAYTHFKFILDKILIKDYLNDVITPIFNHLTKD